MLCSDGECFSEFVMCRMTVLLHRNRLAVRVSLVDVPRAIDRFALLSDRLFASPSTERATIDQWCLLIVHNPGALSRAVQISLDTAHRQRSAVGRRRKSVCATVDRCDEQLGQLLRERAGVSEWVDSEWWGYHHEWRISTIRLGVWTHNRQCPTSCHSIHSQRTL